MTDLNNVVLIGNLTKDCEVKASSSGNTVVKFTIASNKSKKNGDKFEDYVSYLDCNLWGKSGDSLKGFLLKGQKVGISGSLKQERWEKDDQKFSKVVIDVNSIQLIGGRKESSETATASSKELEDIFSADVPF